MRKNTILLVIDALCHPFQQTELSYNSSLKPAKKRSNIVYNEKLLSVFGWRKWIYQK